MAKGLKTKFEIIIRGVEEKRKYNQVLTRVVECKFLIYSTLMFYFYIYLVQFDKVFYLVVLK